MLLLLFENTQRVTYEIRGSERKSTATATMLSKTTNFKFVEQLTELSPYDCYTSLLDKSLVNKSDTNFVISDDNIPSSCRLGVSELP